MGWRRGRWRRVSESDRSRRRPAERKLVLQPVVVEVEQVVVAVAAEAAEDARPREPGHQHPYGMLCTYRSRGASTLDTPCTQNARIATGTSAPSL